MNAIGQAAGDADGERGQALVIRRGDPSTAAPQSNATPASPSVPPIAAPKTRTLELFVFGKTTLRSLTTTVNGQAMTVNNVTLSWRRIVNVPLRPEISTWRIDYHHSAGEFNWKLLVDGVRIRYWTKLQHSR